MPVNQALGGEGGFPVLHVSLQNVSNLHMHLFADVLGNHDLKLVFHGDDINGSLHSNSLTVQQTDWPGILTPEPSFILPTSLGQPALRHSCTYELRVTELRSVPTARFGRS
jgi:hypothetical protein